MEATTQKRVFIKRTAHYGGKTNEERRELYERRKKFKRDVPATTFMITVIKPED